MRDGDEAWRSNWAGTHRYGARRLVEPASVEAIQELVRGERAVRVLGTRHAFNGLADTPGTLVSLRGLPRVVDVAADRTTVRVDGGARYADLFEPMAAADVALPALASLPHLSVAGAVSTGTHGSGDRTRNLGAAVVAIELVTADGERRILTRVNDPDDFDGAVAALGAIGVVTALTLAVEPAYRVAQVVYEDLPSTSAIDHLAEILAAGDSVSLFSEWRSAVIDQVWVKRRVADDATEDGLPGILFGAMRAPVDRHPIRRLSAAACTVQRGIPGPWHERLTHFRAGAVPSAGEEIQSEYVVGRADAPAALAALAALRDRFSPVLLTAEIRSIAADDQWLSMAFGRDSVAFHFTWRREADAVRAVLPEIEAVLAPFGPRPHWGKVWTLPPSAVRDAYPRRMDAVRLMERLDPGGTFRNALVEACVVGGR